MPLSSKFAKPGKWGLIQKKDPYILCFYLASATGLLLCILHNIFCQFQYKTSILLPNNLVMAEVVAIWIATSRLYLKIADNF